MPPLYAAGPPRLCLVLLLILAAAGCSPPAAAAVRVPAPVKLGLAAPVMGPEQAAGQRTLQAVRLAVAQRNARGGVAGRPVEFVVHDDHAPGNGALAAQRFALDPAVLAVLGHTGPQSADAAAPVYRDGGLAAVLLGDVAAARGAPSWVVRLAPSLEATATTAVQFAARTLAARTVAVVAGPSSADAAQAEALQQAARSAGLRVVRAEALFPSSTDYAGTVARLAAARPDAVLLAAGLPTSAAFWREAAGAAPAALVIGTTAALAQEFAALAGPAARTAYLPALVPLEGEHPELAAVTAAFRERWGDAPDAAALLAYDAAGLLLEAMDRALRRAPADPRAAVREELRGLRSSGGATGRLRFDENGVAAQPGPWFELAVP